MDRSDFKIIKGGIRDDERRVDNADAMAPRASGLSVIKTGTTEKYEFVSAWVTDTRLMAVNAMYAHYRSTVGGDESSALDLHLFFYFDSVETGFERFERYEGNDPKALRHAELSFAGGLGGTKISISESEMLSIFTHYVNMNKRLGLEDPAGHRDYAFLLELAKKETIGIGDIPSSFVNSQAFDKMCKAPLTDLELVNYFMMQVANRDDDGIRFLSAGYLDENDSPADDVDTLYKNEISRGSDDTYICESLIESDSGYEIWKSVIEIEEGPAHYVKSFSRASKIDISDTEAYLALSHSEFVMVYKMKDDAAELTEDSTPLTHHATRVEDDDGYSFMLFRPDNNHVDSKSYRLYDDMFGMYHVTSTGELVCSANSQHDMGMLELDIVFSPFYQSLELTGNFEFNEPVMAQFLASGYDDFDEFMHEITDE